MSLTRHLLTLATPVDGVPGLLEIGRRGGLETVEGLRFLAELCRTVRPALKKVLEQRTADRAFLDARVAACGLGVIGLQDGNGRTVIGPLSSNFNRAGGKPIAPLPKFLQ